MDGRSSDWIGRRSSGAAALAERFLKLPLDQLLPLSNENRASWAEWSEEAKQQLDQEEEQDRRKRKRKEQEVLMQQEQEAKKKAPSQDEDKMRLLKAIFHGNAELVAKLLRKGVVVDWSLTERLESNGWSPAAEDAQERRRREEKKDIARACRDEDTGAFAIREKEAEIMRADRGEDARAWDNQYLGWTWRRPDNAVPHEPPTAAAVEDELNAERAARAEEQERRRGERAEREPTEQERSELDKPRQQAISATKQEHATVPVYYMDSFGAFQRLDHETARPSRRAADPALRPVLQRVTVKVSGPDEARGLAEGEWEIEEREVTRHVRG